MEVPDKVVSEMEDDLEAYAELVKKMDARIVELESQVADLKRRIYELMPPNDYR